MKKVLATLTCLVLIASCSKSSGDTSAPVIVLQTPTVGSTNSGAKYISVKAAVSDDDEIHEVHLDVTNKSSGEVMHYHYHPDAKTFDINENVPAASGSTYQVKVEADDHSGNNSEKESEIVVQ